MLSYRSLAKTSSYGAPPNQSALIDNFGSIFHSGPEPPSSTGTLPGTGSRSRHREYLLFQDPVFARPIEIKLTYPAKRVFRP